MAGHGAEAQGLFRPAFWALGCRRAPLSLEPLARFVTGGAGARPDHPISRHELLRIAVNRSVYFGLRIAACSGPVAHRRDTDRGVSVIAMGSPASHLAQFQCTHRNNFWFPQLSDIRQKELQMHAADRFLKFATECQVMAQRASQRENKRVWNRLAERWRRCAKLTEQLDTDLRSSELRRRQKHLKIITH